MFRLLPTLTLFLLTAIARAGDGWFADYDAAVEQARKDKKDLLVDFTGSDWCGWCIRLHKEVFAHAEFTDAVTKDYVLVALDYPRSQAAIDKVPNPKRNAELQQLHKITGYPSVLLMTADGEVFGRTGYQKGGPGAYVAHLAELRAGRAPISARVAYETASAAEKDAAWLKVAAAADAVTTVTPAAKKLVPILREGLAADPDGSKGRKHAAIAGLLSLGESDAELLAAARALDPKNERGLVQRALLAEYLTAKAVEDAKLVLAKIEALDAEGAIKPDRRAFELYAMSAMLLANSPDELPRAKAFATKALAIGSPDNKRLLAICEQLAK